MKIVDKGLTIQKKQLTTLDRWLYYLTESVLLIAGIPAVILFFIGVVNGLIMLVQQDEYQKCIFEEKVKKLVAGKDPDEVSDMLQWHLRGSAIWCFVIVILYGQIMFSVIRVLYKYTGAVVIMFLVFILAFNSVSVAWVSSNACDKTDYYAMAITNNTIIYILVLLTLIFSLILTSIGLCSGADKDEKVSNKEESQENMNVDPPSQAPDSHDNPKITNNVEG